MKKLESLNDSKIGKAEFNKLLGEVKKLKTKISNPQLSKIINKSTTKIINNIDIVVKNQIDNKVVVQNKTDKIQANKNYIFPTWSDGYDISAPFGNDIIKLFISNKSIKKTYHK